MENRKDGIKQLRDSIATAYENLKDQKPTADQLTSAVMEMIDPEYRMTWENAARYKRDFNDLRRLAVVFLARKKNPNYTAFAGTHLGE